MIGTSVEKAAEYLRAGEAVAIPTETVYGLAANALYQKAVTRIFEIKDRPRFNPLILHIGDIDQINVFAENIPEKAFELVKKFWPGPLTLVLKKSPLISDLLTAGNEGVAIRMPNHPLSLELLKKLRFPLAAPSANPFGYVSPTTALHVERQLGDKIPYILDGGQSAVGLESTIVSFLNDEPVLLRAGGLATEEIEKITGELKHRTHSSSPLAPGQLASHYSPDVKIILGDIKENLKKYAPEKVAILSLSEQFTDVPVQQQIQLSRTGDLAEAARNLFASLRSLDQLPVGIILAELVPEIGLGRAINDRLKRAATPK